MPADLYSEDVFPEIQQLHVVSRMIPEGDIRDLMDMWP